MADDLKHLPINYIQANPFQPRDKIQKEDITELISSIKQHGILEPLVVAQTPAGYQLIAGERRWRAAKEVGLTKVPVHIRRTTPKGMLEMAIVENVQRTNLTPIERAQAFQKMVSDFGFTVEQVAERVGKTKSYVSNSLRLLKLPDAIKDALLSGETTEGHARALLGIKDERVMMKCFRIILKEKATVRRAEELAREYRNETELQRVLEEEAYYQEIERLKGKVDNSRVEDIKVPASESREKKIKKVRETLSSEATQKMIAQFEKKIKNRFHVPSDFKMSRSSRQTKVTITLKGDEARTQADIQRLLEIVAKN